MKARGRLLDFVGSVAATTQWEDERRLLEAHAPPRVASRPAADEDLVQRFRHELETLGGQWLDGGGDTATILSHWLGRQAVELARPLRIVVDPQLARLTSAVAEGLEMASPGTLEVVPGTCFEAVPGTCAQTPGRAELAAADLGITLVDAAIAETGTLVEWPRPGRPRAMSLLPPHHLAVLSRQRLVAGLEDFFDHIEDLEGDGDAVDAVDSYFTWISGPSRTADIEKVLTVGVHGPGRLTVLWIDDLSLGT